MLRSGFVSFYELLNINHLQHILLHDMLTFITFLGVRSKLNHSLESRLSRLDAIIPNSFFIPNKIASFNTSVAFTSPTSYPWLYTNAFEASHIES